MGERGASICVVAIDAGPGRLYTPPVTGPTPPRSTPGASDASTSGLGWIVRAWLPLAASWMLMACELPVISAVVARLLDPKIELAAYGSVIMPIALVVEAPIIMLLAASTALSRDRASYTELRRFTQRSGMLLTALHLALALSPAYDLVVGGWLGAPPPVAEAARLGLLIMTPWTWAIAYRRFNQGVLIRFGHSRAVTIGTVLRMAANVSVLALGWWSRALPGAVLAASAVATGVTVEAIYSGLVVRPVVRKHLARDDPETAPLRGRAFLAFYVPLALTPMIALLTQPLAAASITRMPEALPSLAVAPVVTGLLFMLQSVGLALSEVVIAGLEQPGRARDLWRFSLILATVVGLVIAAMATGPLARLWFGTVSGLSPQLVHYAQGAIVLGIPTPFMRALQSWYGGVLVHTRETRAISEAVVIFLIVAGAVLSVGIASGRVAGVYVAMAAISLGRVTQVLWLWWRSREAIRNLFDMPALST